MGTPKPGQTLIDFITGKEIPNIGWEENRQMVARMLVENKGYSKKDIEVDADIALTIKGKPYESKVDLVVSMQAKRVLAIKCAAGSLNSCEREIIAAARLLDNFQIPFAVVSDGINAIVWDTITGECLGKDIAAIPTQKQLTEKWGQLKFQSLPESRAQREALIFRTYDMEYVNVRRWREEV